jgi:hypothetical protein
MSDNPIMLPLYSFHVYRSQYLAIEYVSLEQAEKQLNKDGYSCLPCSLNGPCSEEFFEIDEHRLLVCHIESLRVTTCDEVYELEPGDCLSIPAHFSFHVDSKNACTFLICTEATANSTEN